MNTYYVVLDSKQQEIYRSTEKSLAQGFIDKLFEFAGDRGIPYEKHEFSIVVEHTK